MLDFRSGTKGFTCPCARRPLKAGSWYTDDPAQLTSQLTAWLGEAQMSCGQARAIIAPHAGFAYSGPTAAWAYKHVVGDGVRRVFLLGPSHSMYSSRCLLSGCSAYATPMGSMDIDQQVYDELAATGLFDEMSLAVDEKEHSLEMHLPFILQAMGGRPFTLVPIMVGALSEESESCYGKLLAPYLADPQNFFVVSSDFCHWGERFNFVYQDPRHGAEIHQSVEALDRQGMALIEAQDAAGFASYLNRHGNTICGRHPIAVLLHALQACTERQIGHQLKFVRYAQSSRCRRPHESSVSYASAVVWR